jgi:hypothetical protein
VCAAVGIIVIPRLLFAVTTRNLSKAAALEEQVSVKSSLHGLSCAKCMAYPVSSAWPIWLPSAWPFLFPCA